MDSWTLDLGGDDVVEARGVSGRDIEEIAELLHVRGDEVASPVEILRCRRVPQIAYDPSGDSSASCSRLPSRSGR